MGNLGMREGGLWLLWGEPLLCCSHREGAWQQMAALEPLSCRWLLAR